MKNTRTMRPEMTLRFAAVLAILCSSCSRTAFLVDDVVDDVVDVTPQASRLTFSVQPPGGATANTVWAAFSLTALDMSGATVTAFAGPVALSAFLDAGCVTTPASGTISGTPVLATRGVALFDAVQYDNSGTIYLKASSGALSSACSSAIDVSTSLVALAWIGQQSVGGSAAQWATSGTAVAGSDVDYALNAPIGVTTDASYLYVADTTNGRVSRFELATGVAFGWIGQVGVSTGLTGPAGAGTCPSTVVGTFTGGWCSGGAAQINASGQGGGGMAFPSGLANDATYLYVLDEAGSRLIRFTKGTGAFAGWVGAVGSLSGITCESGTPSLNVVTPSWCIGGASQIGDGNGMLHSDFEGIATDGVSIYVPDAYNGELYKFDAATGAFVGWIGGVGSVAGMVCQSGTPVVGDPTPSWCAGGTCAGGDGDGMFYAGGAGNGYMSVALGSDNLYATDGRYGPSHVQRFSATGGVFSGWIGEVASIVAINCESGTPTGGASAPSWCTGGDWSRSSTDPGGFSGPSGVHVDASYLYVADAPNNTVQRFTLSGVFAGWKGVVQTPPTGGEPGCDAATAGTYTPGWCVGGAYDTAGGSATIGQLSLPAHLSGDARYLYVADSQNHRILRIAK